MVLTVCCCPFSDSLRTEIATLTGESLPEVTDVSSSCLRSGATELEDSKVHDGSTLHPAVSGVASLARSRELYLEASLGEKPPHRQCVFCKSGQGDLTTENLASTSGRGQCRRFCFTLELLRQRLSSEPSYWVSCWLTCRCR